MTESSVLIIIPTYEEGQNIDNVLHQVRAAYPPATVLVVDDNSPDDTADLARKAGNKLGQIEVMARPGKSGLGSAYRDGFRWGLERGFDILVEMDADLSHDPKVLPRLVEAVEAGSDLAVGSRYVPGGAIPGWPTHRALLSRWGNRYAMFMLRMKLNDATSGFRAYKGTILRQIDLNHVRADGYGFQIEMAYRVTRLGGIIREVPITFIDRVEGTSKMSGKIIYEALGLVTMWGITDAIRRITGRA